MFSAFFAFIEGLFAFVLSHMRIYRHAAPVYRVFLWDAHAPEDSHKGDPQRRWSP